MAGIAGTAIVVCLILALYGAVLRDLAIEWWTTPAFSHGLVVLPFSAYVVWLRRGPIGKAPARTDHCGLSLVVLGCCLFTVGKLAAEYFLLRISILVTIAGLIHTFWGAPRLRLLAMPLVLLATALPLPALLYAQLSIPLQLIASDMAARIAEFAGVTLYRDGNVIQLANLTLGVEEACSGLVSLSALAVGGMLFGSLSCRSRTGQILVLAAAVPIALAANILRISGTAVLSDWRPDLAIGFYHSFSGWLVFVTGLALLYAVSMSVQKLER